MSPPTPMLRAVLTKSASKANGRRTRSSNFNFSENTPDSSTDSIGRR